MCSDFPARLRTRNPTFGIAFPHAYRGARSSCTTLPLCLLNIPISLVPHVVAQTSLAMLNCAAMILLATRYTRWVARPPEAL